MNPSRFPSCAGAGLRTCVLSLLLLVLGLHAPAASAAAAPPGRAAVVTTAAPLLAEGRWSWRKLYSPLEGVLGNRTRMIQFCSLAMILALYIIWWRK